MPARLGQQESEVVARLGHGDMQAVAVQVDGDDEMLASDLLGYEGDRLRERSVATQVGHRQAEEVRQCVDETPLVEGAHVDEHLSEPLPRTRLLLERLRDLGVA